MKRRVADIIIDLLIENNIDTCFSVVGGGAMHLNNAFVLAKKQIRTIYNHHEQACSMAAEGYARLTGKISAVCVTSGPGGTNAINGVQGAWVDSIPMLVIAGHPRYETTVNAAGLDIRTRGVQENDIVTQVSTITKYAKLITDPLSVKAEIQKAIDMALCGRRGPVWISVPLNVQSALVEEDELYEAETMGTPLGAVAESQIAEMVEIFSTAKRPCLLTGSGLRTSDAIAAYRKFIKNVTVPIVGGALQADINYNGEQNYYGMSGNIGTRAGNFILQSADVILVLGNSLGTCQTGFNVEAFAPNARIIMVDAEKDEAKKPGLHIELFIHSDLNAFFEHCVKMDLCINADSLWFEHCDYLYRCFPKYEALERHGAFRKEERIPVILFWKEFMERVQTDAVITLGNSSCVRGLLQLGIEHPEQRVLVNYNCGSMGDDITEAIGAAVGTDKSLYCVTGDGSFMLNIQELQTIAYHQFPIKIVLFNNQGYAAIRNTCKNYFEGLNAGCDYESGISFPDFSKISTAFEVPFFRISCIGELSDGLNWITSQKGPCILEIYQKMDEIEGPKIVSKLDDNGQFVTPALHDMSPFLSEDEINQYLLNDE